MSFLKQNKSSLIILAIISFLEFIIAYFINNFLVNYFASNKKSATAMFLIDEFWEKIPKSILTVFLISIYVIFRSWKTKEDLEKYHSRFIIIYIISISISWMIIGKELSDIYYTLIEIFLFTINIPVVLGIKKLLKMWKNLSKGEIFKKVHKFWAFFIFLSLFKYLLFIYFKIKNIFFT